MVSEEEVEAFIVSYFPQCPLCGASKGYSISGTAKIYAQCRSCGAKWMSTDFPQRKEIKEMFLLETTRDGRGTSLRNRIYPGAFWRDSTSVQNALKMEGTISNSSISSSISASVNASNHSGMIDASDILSDSSLLVSLRDKYIVISDQALVGRKFDNMIKAINLMAEKGWRCINITSFNTAGETFSTKIQMFALMEKIG